MNEIREAPYEAAIDYLAKHADISPAGTWILTDEQLRELIVVVAAEALKAAARALMAEADTFAGKSEDMWDRGYVRGMQRAAHNLANSIDRPEVLTEATHG